MMYYTRGPIHMTFYGGGATGTCAVCYTLFKVYNFHIIIILHITITFSIKYAINIPQWCPPIPLWRPFKGTSVYNYMLY